MFRLGIGTWVIPFLLFFSLPFSFSGEIYRWTDEQGGVHFTDDILRVPTRYRDQVEKKTTRESTEEAEKDSFSGAGPQRGIGPAEPPLRQEGKPDRVKDYLQTIEEKIEAKRKIEKKISELEDEMKAAEERIKLLEKDEEDNYPLIQPHFSRRGFVPVAGPHFQERQDLTNRIKAIREELALLEEKLSDIKRGL